MCIFLCDTTARSDLRICMAYLCIASQPGGVKYLAILLETLAITMCDQHQFSKTPGLFTNSHSYTAHNYYNVHVTNIKLHCIAGWPIMEW